MEEFLSIEDFLKLIVDLGVSEEELEEAKEWFEEEVEHLKSLKEQ